MKFLILMSSMILASTTASALSIGNTVRDLQGQPIFMTYEEAANYCQNNQMRIPTAREFAELSQSLGAKGIRETKYPGVAYDDSRLTNEFYQSSLYQEHFKRIFKQSLSGLIEVDFYYSDSGYDFNSKESWENLWIWTSSVHPSIYYKPIPDLMKTWQSSIGNFVWARQSEPHAVRCIQD